jgi:hypothetical protein
MIDFVVVVSGNRVKVNLTPKIYLPKSQGGREDVYI